MNIAIAGYGVEGRSNYAYWSRDPENVLTIVDEKLDPQATDLPENVAVKTGAGVFEQLHGYDLVIRTAGLAPYKIATDGKIWSGTNEFFEKCQAHIIGVTGSKGKGTTASLIASMLEAAGKKVWLVGNIGLPALEVLDQIQPEDIVVYELSSFQLWDAERSPHVAVVLFIEREHQDVHRSMEEYVEAKAHISRHQTANDIIIFNADNQYARQIADGSLAQKIGFPADTSAHIEDGVFYYDDTALCAVEALQLKGEHNHDNAVAAIDAVWQYVQNPEAIETGLRTFKGLPHRLAYVATVNDVEYYDDSISTTPGSAIAALEAFKEKPKVIILGGSSKDSDFTELAAAMTHHDVKALLVGAEAPTISHALDAVGFTDYETLGDVTAVEFTKHAAEVAQPGSVVLLSPAAASFGMFKNYADRGDQFIAAVKSL